MRPTIGITMSLTSESTILANAAPMITPTARSTTLPLAANSLNSDAKLISDLLDRRRTARRREYRPARVPGCCNRVSLLTRPLELQVDLSRRDSSQEHHD